MPGLFARIIMKSMMKNKRKEPHYIPQDYDAARAAMNKVTAMVPVPKSIQKEKSVVNGVPVVWFVEKGVKTKKLVYYIHGGGFNTGSAEFSHLLPVNLCKKGGWTVISADYRLAPEHPYPAGLDDCFSVYRGLLDMGYRGSDIALMGDSAGGDLIFALTLQLRDEGLPLPAALCGFSPVAVLDDSLPSRLGRVARDPNMGADFTEEMEATYLQGHSASDPYVSPGYGDLRGFSPIWMCVGTEEIFYDDAFLLKENAEAAGVPVELFVGEGMCHVYPNLPDKITTRTFKSVREFLNKRLGK